MKRSLKKQIIEITDQLYSKTGQNISLKDSSFKVYLDGFIDILDEKVGLPSIGTSYIRDYFIFQFNYWIDKNTRFGSTIMPNWILGKAAFQRWMDKNEHWKYFNSLFIKKYRIIFDRNFTRVDLEDVEELERKRFHNQDEGLIHCRDFSSYNKYSTYCKTCRFRRDCYLLEKNC